MPIRLTRWQTASSDCGDGRSFLRSRLVTSAERLPVGTVLRNRRPTSSGMANVIFMQAICRERNETQLKTARAIFKSGAVTRTMANFAAGFIGYDSIFDKIFSNAFLCAHFGNLNAWRHTYKLFCEFHIW